MTFCLCGSCPTCDRQREESRAQAEAWRERIASDRPMEKLDPQLARRMLWARVKAAKKGAA